MKFNLLKWIVKVLLVPTFLFLTNEVLPQCEVFIEPGSVVVTDNGGGVKFEFDITNNSSSDWYGDDLKMYWSLNSGAPIWSIDYSQNTNQPPISPGETRTIKTPWFDIPNLPSWFPNDPDENQPWVESQEWAYYGLSYPFEGSWSQINLRLGSCGLADGAWVFDNDGEPYYGPFNSDCTDSNNDALCDCDLEIINFDEVSLDIEVEVVSHWNCGQPLNGLNNVQSSNNDGVNMIYFGIHVPEWDYQWGCTSGANHPGWSFTGWSTSGNPNTYLYSGDIFQANLNDLSPPSTCFSEILNNDTINECTEIVLWQINFSKTLSEVDGGWSVFPSSGNQTQEYPDFNIGGNSILLCEIPDVNGCTDPIASNFNPNANTEDGSCEYLYPNANPGYGLVNTICEDGVPSNIYNIFVFNPGNDTLFNYCLEIPELGFDECFNGYNSSNLWIAPNQGQLITQIIVPEGIEQITVNIYESEGELSDTFDDNIEVINVIFGDEDPCEVLGCTQLNAVNYNPNATEDDGSCYYGVNISLDTISYTTDCDGITPYWSPTLVLTNNGVEPITEFCVVEDILGTAEPNDTVCYESIVIQPGETLELEWVDMYEWGVLSVRVINVNGESGVSWNDFGQDDEISDNMYVQVVFNQPNCIGDELTLSLGDEIIWSPQGDCVNPFYNQSFIVNNVGQGVVSNFNLDLIVTTWNNDTVYQDTHEYNVDIEPNDSYIVSDLPDIFTGDLNYVTVTITWVNELGQLDEDVQTFNIILYCYGCTDTSASNYTESPYIFDEVQDYWLDVFPNISEPTPEQIECEYDVYGCTDSNANNYNPNANIDDGSCNYDVYGCTDIAALNYNLDATIEDGTCIYSGPCDEFEGDAFAPNAFTPNNDGLNDSWRVLTDEECWRTWDLLIYNRWGQVVYEMDSPSQVWDGSFKGGDYYVSDGVYAYTLRGVAWNLKSVEVTGYITVLR